MNMRKIEKKLPVFCPSCEAELNVHSLQCQSCNTSITGSFGLPLLLKLDPKDLDFIIQFIKCSGSLKIMASNLKLSYPTVRNMLDEIISKIENFNSESNV